MDEKDAQAKNFEHEMEKEREEITKLKNIETIYLGNYKIGTWYYSPYPDEYKHVSCMYLCEFCLKYMKYPHSLVQHVVSIQFFVFI